LGADGDEGGVALNAAAKNYAMKSAVFNPKVHEYLTNCEAFAQPIFMHLRTLLHQTCPEVVEEIKWGIPHFDYHGDMMCIFAAYAKHVSFTFFKQSIMRDPRLRDNLSLPAAKRYMGKLTSVADLPPDLELIVLIKEAMTLNENGIKLTPQSAKTPAVIDMPEEFSKALASHPKAKAVFETKTGSFRKDYLVWITSAKTDATRHTRIKESIEWIAESKSRFWKYQK
jgi:uncharacterized protein YdeI (YjbR/CyaY-like superfamily)